MLAISCKGAIKAFRNLTNRLEEAVGDCTNIHITYPALVAGYLFALRANRAAGIVAEEGAAGTSPRRQLAANDIAIGRGGDPVEAILRFHYALSELTGRRGIRDDVSRYESVALALVEPEGAHAGMPLEGFPCDDSRIRLRDFFSTLYLRYDERYVYGAPDLKRVTRRRFWADDSPAFVAGGRAACPTSRRATGRASPGRRRTRRRSPDGGPPPAPAGGGACRSEAWR